MVSLCWTMGETWGMQGPGGLLASTLPLLFSEPAGSVPVCAVSAFIPHSLRGFVLLSRYCTEREGGSPSRIKPGPDGCATTWRG